MIPFGDATRRQVHIPVVTIALILANIFMFYQELVHGNGFVRAWALVPAHISHYQDLFTILTAMFLHAGWLHLLGNMLFLWVFGPAVEDSMGAVKYLAFYLLGGLVASLAQILVDPSSTVPNLGASGAIAAVMGAFLVNFPRDRIRTLIILGFFIQVTTLPAILLIGVWFLLQLVSQLGFFGSAGSAGVAFMAHIGGLIFGVALSPFFVEHKRVTEEGY